MILLCQRLGRFCVASVAIDYATTIAKTLSLLSPAGIEVIRDAIVKVITFRRCNKTEHVVVSLASVQVALSPNAGLVQDGTQSRAGDHA